MNSIDFPLVTVVSLCYNTGKYVTDALECVRKQTYQNIQHIIIDDCSSDNSVSLISEWISKNNYSCTFIKNDVNTGIPAVFNKALEVSNGKYITWISDDLWEENRIDRTVNIFESMPENVDVIFGKMKLINEHGQNIDEINPSKALSAAGYPKPEEIFGDENKIIIIDGHAAKHALFWRCYIPAPTVTVRRNLYNKIGKYDESISIEDLDCLFRASENSSFAFVPEILVAYRIHGSNFTSGLNEKYIKSLIKTLYRYLPKENKELKLAVKKHIREEAYRIALNLIKEQHIDKSLHYFYHYYLPNTRIAIVCIKEVLKFSKAIIENYISKLKW